MTMPTIELINKKSFNAAAGTSILDNALAAGLTLEHGCRNGRCGACRTHVLEGSTTALLPEEGLSPREQAEGWILSCARAPQSDLRLDIEDLGALAGIQTKTLPCRIDNLERLAPDVMKVVLRLPPAASPAAAFKYLSGQYINVIARDGQRRSYSLANSAQASRASHGPDKLELHIRRVAGGTMSHYWFDLAQPNDLLRFEGPLGTFFLRDCAGLDVVFLATGTGVAPIKAMLADIDRLLSPQRPRSVTLLWGGRQVQDLYWTPDNDDLIYLPVLSRAGAGATAAIDPGATPDWRGAHGHVQDALLEQHRQRPRDWARTVVYACGSNDMITSARAALSAAGLPANRFYSDAFVSSASALATVKQECAA